MSLRCRRRFRSNSVLLRDWAALAVLSTAFILGCDASSCGDSTKQAISTEQSQAPVAALPDRVSWSVLGSTASEIGLDELKELTRAALAGVSVASASGPAGRIDVTGSLDTTAGEGALILEARLDPSPYGVPISATLVATGSAMSPEEARSLVRRGLGDLVDAFSSLLRLAQGSPKDWIRALDSPEPDEQTLAAALLGHGQVAEAVPRLGKLLSDPRVPVAEAAADAIVAIGDRKAVPLIINSIRRGDLRSEVRAIEAMIRLGGAEAEAYLEMTAFGHEIEEVRDLSRRALQDLRAGK